jgi:MoxR-like ATPase
MATQNPIESDGTYPLPEAQVDRFMLKVLVDYPTNTEEFVIVERMVSGLERAQSVLGATQLSALQKAAQAVFVDPSLIEYAVTVSNATRDLSSIRLGEMARYVTYGVSPRASIYMILAAQALALVRGREYALPEDVYSVAPDVLRHRLVLSYEALGDNVSPDHIVRAILANIPLPEVVLRERGATVGTGGTGDDWKWAPPPR